jgi:hypothetical protein
VIEEAENVMAELLACDARVSGLMGVDDPTVTSDGGAA